MESLVQYQKVYIEISNICNLQCDFCPPVERHKKIMSLQDFEKVLIQVAPLTERVCLHLMGEPLGHPHLREILEVCEKQNVFIELTTNGTLISKKMTELMSPCIGQVNISVHSFEANFPEKDVESYLNHVFRFIDQSLIQKPKTYINLRIWDLSDPACLSKKNIKIRQLIEARYNFNMKDIKVDVRRKKGYQIQDTLYLHFDSRFVWPDLRLPILQERGTCQALKHHIGIHADGTVVACCLDKEAHLSLGNCLNQPLNEALASERSLRIRKGFDEGRLIEDLCKRCSYIERFNRKEVVTQ
jgi:radical SAM protein with 4Fe4S-binding SPASM domain